MINEAVFNEIFNYWAEFKRAVDEYNRKQRLYGKQIEKEIGIKVSISPLLVDYTFSEFMDWLANDRSFENG